MLLLALALAAAAPTPGDARLLTELVAGAAAADKRLDVLTSEDMRRAVDLEAQRQTAGCDETGCLAEVASALGARYVIYGSLGQLGEGQLVLTLTLFDSSTATSLDRALVRGKDLAALSDQIDGAVTKLTSETVSTPSSAKPRLLVLDLEVKNGLAVEAPAEGPATNWLLVGGIAGAGLGAAGVVVGAVFDGLAVAADDAARDAKTTQREAAAKVKERDDDATVAAVAYLAGGAALVAGAAAAVVGALE